MPRGAAGGRLVGPSPLRRQRPLGGGTGLRQGGYGMTAQEIEDMWARQGSVCLLCGRPRLPGKQLTVDHDHAMLAEGYSLRSTVRGVLHVGCNTLLGIVGDDEALLLRAVDYLRAAREGKR